MIDNNTMFKQRLVAKLYRSRTSLFRTISTCIAYIKCWIWGIKIGKGCTFIGPVLFYKEPGSTIKIGNNCRFSSSSYTNFRGINHPCIIQTGTKSASITIGDECCFSGISIVCNNSITIEDNCAFGANASIGDRDGHRKRYATEDKKIHIGHDTWLGMNVTVLKGVTIGSNCVVGANSLVTKDIPDNVVAVGSPAKVIKQKK